MAGCGPVETTLVHDFSDSKYRQAAAYELLTETRT